MAEVADVLRRCAGAYLAQFGGRILPSHRRALGDLVACRTEALGGHVCECDHCGALRYAYHSCRNRSCSKCNGARRQRWLDRERRDLLPVSYFHVVFTLPQELREVLRRHQKALYGALIRAAAESLMKLAADPRYIGGRIGVVCVLHTWTRALLYHPHVHCLVPGGAPSSDATGWRPARNRFLVPVAALSAIFRARFMRLARSALPDERFPQSLWDRSWVVHAKPAIQGPERVLDYLGRYVHRVAITNRRILSLDDHGVTFRYKDSREQRWKTMTLSHLEFTRRLLQHVLPRGVHKVRNFGLFAPSNRHRLPALQAALTKGKGDEDRGASEEPKVKTDPRPPPRPPPACPHCALGHMVVILWIPRAPRAPP